MPFLSHLPMPPPHDPLAPRTPIYWVKLGGVSVRSSYFWVSGGLDADLESSQGMGVAVGGRCAVMGEGYIESAFSSGGNYSDV